MFAAPTPTAAAAWQPAAAFSVAFSVDSQFAVPYIGVFFVSASCQLATSHYAYEYYAGDLVTSFVVSPPSRRTDNWARCQH